MIKNRYLPSVVDKPWWLAGGIPTSACVIAYQSVGASSLAASYNNLTGISAYNLTLGNAPTWTSATGWSFNGTSNYLKTNYVPAVGANLSIFVRAYRAAAADGAGNVDTLLGQHAASSPYNGVFIRYGNSDTAISLYANDGLSATSTVTRTGTHVLGIAGRQGWYDGAEDGAAFADVSQAFGNYDIVLGALQYSSIIQYEECMIHAVSFYETVLTRHQIQCLTNAMNAL